VTDNFQESVLESGAGTESSLPESSAKWSFINSWKVEPQSDDRPRELGVATANTASPSIRRSTARRRHQAMFKEWSQNRHD